MRIRRQTGQAAVEGIAITVLLAILLAATSAWLAAVVQPAAAPPPDAIGRVVEPLGAGRSHSLWERPALPSFLDRSTTRRGPAPVGRALRALGRGARTGVVVGFEARQAFLDGFGERLQARIGQFLRDPLGSPEDLPDHDFFTSTGLTRALIERSGEVYDYALYLRSLPPRVAVVTASRDAGRLSADAALQYGKAALRRRVMRGGPGTDPPPPGDPAPPRAP